MCFNLMCHMSILKVKLSLQKSKNPEKITEKASPNAGVAGDETISHRPLHPAICFLSTNFGFSSISLLFRRRWLPRFALP